MPLAIGGNLGPRARYFRYDGAGNIILLDSVDIEDRWWGISYGGYPEEPVIAGQSKPMLRVFGIVLKVAGSEAPVLVEGETGTGKELIGRALASPKRGPFEAVNCSLPTDGVSFEDTFFGRVDKVINGAPGAPGAFQLAHRGTLFLDHIDSLSWNQQGKLLRVIQSRPQVVRRLGSSVDEKVNVRIIAASNRRLGFLIRQGLFREDLYARLRVVQINLPPLRERKDDIPLLTVYFLLKNRHHFARKIKVMASETVEQLCAYNWPLNVRGLYNALESALLLGEGPVLSPEDCAPYFRQPCGTGAHLRPPRRVSKRPPRSGRQARIEKLVEFLEQKPGATQRELAHVASCSKRTIQRDLDTPSGKLITSRNDETDARVLRYYVSPSSSPLR